jgi:hypothetical protein
MKQLIPTNVPGKFTVKEVRQFTGGPNVGKDWECNYTVYETAIQAGVEGAKQTSGNTILVGVNEHDVNGETYYSPTFNVCD